jgi:transitional endoplasmic reticulum ATPase
MVSGPEIFSQWLGESEEALRHVFRLAKQISPSIILFDQLDALAPKRRNDSGSQTTERVVSQLLTELDSISTVENVTVIGTTNRMELIDPAVLRPGRFGLHIHIPLPSMLERKQILEGFIKESYFISHDDYNYSIQRIVEETEGFSGAELKQLSEVLILSSLDEENGNGKVQLEFSGIQELLNEYANTVKFSTSNRTVDTVSTIST